MRYIDSVRPWVRGVATPVLALSLLQACGGDRDVGGVASGEAVEHTSEALAQDAGGITDPAQTRTLTVTFLLQPGTESVMCQSFANPWGAQVDVKDYVTSTSPGVYEIAALYAQNATSGSVAPCTLNGSEQLTFVSPSPNVVFKYPGAVGARITNTTGFNVYVHALNTGSSPINVTASVTMKVAYPGIVTKPAGLLWLEKTNFSVLPGSQTVTGTYILPRAIKVVAETGEMSHIGTNFTLSAGATTLYQTNAWDEPPIHFEPTQIDLASGTTLTWSCQYDNTTAATLTFGESLMTNVRCRALAFFYSVTDLNNPKIGNTWTL